MLIKRRAFDIKKNIFFIEAIEVEVGDPIQVLDQLFVHEVNPPTKEICYVDSDSGFIVAHSIRDIKLMVELSGENYVYNMVEGFRNLSDREIVVDENRFWSIAKEDEDHVIGRTEKKKHTRRKKK